MASYMQKKNGIGTGGSSEPFQHTPRCDTPRKDRTSSKTEDSGPSGGGTYMQKLKRRLNK